MQSSQSTNPPHSILVLVVHTSVTRTAGLPAEHTMAIETRVCMLRDLVMNDTRRRGKPNCYRAWRCAAATLLLQAG